MHSQSITPIDFCGYINFSNGDRLEAHKIIFAWSIIPIVSVTLGIHFFIKWINNMDYFPLKQRSPLLCVALLVSLLISINLYPSLVITSYYIQDNKPYFLTYTSLYYALRSTNYLIYFIRSLRIVYAYNLQESMRIPKHFVFKFFKYELIPIFLILVLCIVKYLIVCYSPENYNNVYASFININPDPSANTLFFYRKITEIVPWQIILATCLWMQRKVNAQYGIVRQLAAVLLLSIVFSIAQLSSVFFQPNKSGFIGGLRCESSNYSIQQLSLMCHNFLLFLISIVWPVIKDIRYYHTLLPIQQPYDLDNSLKNFLFDPSCFGVFYNFLKSLDKQEEGIPYIEYMLSWTKIIKYKEEEQNEPEEIDELIQKLQIVNLDQKAINTLNQSISVLKSRVSDQEIQDAMHSFNSAMELLSEEIIQHLSIPYRTHFQKTKAYIRLKQIMQDNDRINTNMLMLNMILRQEQGI